MSSLDANLVDLKGDIKYDDILNEEEREGGRLEALFDIYRRVTGLFAPTIVFLISDRVDRCLEFHRFDFIELLVHMGRAKYYVVKGCHGSRWVRVDVGGLGVQEGKESISRLSILCGHGGPQLSLKEIEAAMPSPTSPITTKGILSPSTTTIES